jgi:hypothetical protein
LTRLLLPSIMNMLVKRCVSNPLAKLYYVNSVNGLFRDKLPSYLIDGGVSEWPMVTVLKTVEKLSPKLNWFFHIFHFVRKFPLCPTMFATN